MKNPDLETESRGFGWVGEGPPTQQWLDEKLLDFSANGMAKDVAAMLDLGADIEAKSKSGYSALTCSSYWGHEYTVRMLLERGANTESRDMFGRTALMLSAWYGYTECTRVLIEHGADVDARDDLRQTPLMWAAFGPHTDSLLCLLERGADVHAVDDNGMRAVHHSIDRAQPRILHVLLAQGECVDGRMPSGKSYDDACKSNPEMLAVLKAHRNALIIEKVIRKSLPQAPSPSAASL
jgi:ankyrin repeat protein